jgi:hypothetical protein
MYAYGTCWSCGNPFWFSPSRVPSLPVDPVTNRPPDLGGDAGRAERQPICAACVDLANARRRRDGEPEIVVLPGAYDPDAVV